MRTAIHRAAVLAITVAAGVCVGSALLTGRSLANGPTGVAAHGIPSVSHYRAWYLVNPKPHFVPAPAAVQCAAILLPGPHIGKYVQVYVNPVGRKAMLSPKPTPFPVGSIIVKEKRTTPNGSVELLTVMIKRRLSTEGGTDASWQYAVTDPSGKQVDDDDTARCVSCHAAQQAQDYVFRTYLPAATTKPATRR